VQPSITPGAATLEPPSSAQSSPTTAANTPAPLKSNQSTEPLNFGIAPGPEVVRRTSLNTTPRSISMTLSGEVPPEDETIGSPVMHETLSVIDEHITDMSTPRHSVVGKDHRMNDSGSEYSSHHRLSYVNGHETEEEENATHTEEEVKTWSPARVAEYLEDVGVEKRHCDVFRDQDIDGEALLGVDRNFIFMQEFDLGPMGPRLRTWMKINALQLEVKTAKESAKVLQPAPSFDGHDDVANEGARMRAASTGSVLPRIPTLRESMGSRGTMRQNTLPRAASTAGRSPMDATSPLIQHTPASPTRCPAQHPPLAALPWTQHHHSSSTPQLHRPRAPHLGRPLPPSAT